jgi:hypothetical protein
MASVPSAEVDDNIFEKMPPVDPNSEMVTAVLFLEIVPDTFFAKRKRPPRIKSNGCK